MTLYRFRAATGQGQIVQESFDAPSIDSLASALEGRNLTLLSAEEERSATAAPAERGGTRLAAQDLAMFSRQLASMLRAGVPVAEAIASIGSQGKERERRLFAALETRVRRGESLSEAMARFPQAFTRLYCATIAAAEKVGALETALGRLGEMILNERRLRKTVASSLQYPCAVIVAMLLALIALQQIVVPQFGKVFANLGGNLPLATRLLIGFSDLLSGYWWAMLGGLIAAAALLRSCVATPAGRLWFDRAILGIPHIGTILRHMYLARFARMLGLLYAHGLPIVSALQVLQEAIGNAHIAGDVEYVKNAVSRGSSLGEAALTRTSFTPMFRNMLHMGETTGHLDDAMQVVAEFYEEETARAARDMTQWIEPILTIVLGAFVLFLALAIFLPWWDLSGLYRK